MRGVIVTILFAMFIFYIFYVFSIRREGSPLLETTQAGFPLIFYKYDPTDCEALPCYAKWNYLYLVLDIFIAFVTAVLVRLGVRRVIAAAKKK